MSYKVELTDHFKKEAKRLVIKYRSLKKELATLFIELEQNPTIAIPLTNVVFNIRLAKASKRKVNE